MDLFKETTVALTWELRKAFPSLNALDIAAIIGNGAHECNGFRTLQETKPTVKGSLGGYGYFQWTGPRRRAFMAWCKQNSLGPESFEANAGFLIYELKTSEAGAISRVRKAKTLEDKVIAFELGYERAGVKHYPSRLEWAKKAFAAMPDAKRKEPELEAMIPPPPKALTESKTIWSQVLGYVTGSGATLLAGLHGLDWKVLLVLIVAGTFAGIVIYERVKKG